MNNNMMQADAPHDNQCQTTYDVHVDGLSQTILAPGRRPEAMGAKGSGMDTAMPVLSACARPAMVYALDQSIRVTLGQLSVAALSTDMLMLAIATHGNAPEAIAVRGDAPGLAEQFAPVGGRLAREAVHAAIEVE